MKQITRVGKNVQTGEERKEIWTEVGDNIWRDTHGNHFCKNMLGTFTYMHPSNKRLTQFKAV